MENNRLFELADELKALRDRKDALEAELKQINMDIDNVDWHFVFHDGHEVECLWQDKSRSDSWDENMRQQAAEKTRRRYEK